MAEIKAEPDDFLIVLDKDEQRAFEEALDRGQREFLVKLPDGRLIEMEVC